MRIYVKASEIKVGDIVAPTKYEPALHVQEVNHHKDGDKIKGVSVRDATLNFSAYYPADISVEMLRHT